MIVLIVCNLRDTTEKSSEYEAVAIIEYKGSVKSTGDSAGHYLCDVKDKSSQKWFRTNDNKNPFNIGLKEVSKHAYVVLYSRKPENEIHN